MRAASKAAGRCNATSYDHYALLRACEEALGVTTYLGNAATANDMRVGIHY